MMPAAKTFYSAIVVTLLLTTTHTGNVFAQETLQISTPSDVTTLLQRAEVMLASKRSQAAYDLLIAREQDLAGQSMFDYFLGVAALDTGRLSEAILSLQRVVASAPQFSGARMELARAHFEAGEAGRARSLFSALLMEDPPIGVREVIDQYIAAIDAKSTTPPRTFSPYAELLVGYDDNANGSTDDQQFLGFILSPQNLETDSSFFEAGAGFNWTAPSSASFAWLLGGHTSYRKNPDASFVDAGTVNVVAGGIWRRGAIFGRANVDAYWASRDGDSNESYSGANLVIGRNLNDRWDLTFSLRGGALRYDDSIDVLDVNRIIYSVGAGYRFHSQGRFSIEAIGGSDDERQSGSPYGNSKTGLRLSVSSAIGESAILRASLGSLTSDYDGLFFGAAREDTQLTSVLQFEFRDVMTDGLTLAPRIRYIDNDSDVALYDYDRTEVGLLIRWTP